MVDRLVELAGGGPVLEFASGTGRIALPLSQRGIDVSGIELSPHMTEQLEAKPGSDQVAVTHGRHGQHPGRRHLLAGLPGL